MLDRRKKWTLYRIDNGWVVELDSTIPETRAFNTLAVALEWVWKNVAGHLSDDLRQEVQAGEWPGGEER